MSVLLDKDSRVVVSGVTGSEGTFHTRRNIAYGTNVVAGVTPGKGGQRAVDDKVPVFDTIAEAVQKEGANASLIFASGITCVIIGSIWILPCMYQSTIFGTSVRPRAPPNAVPFQTRPVTSWNGRVEISVPEGATPMMIDSPQPRWQHSRAWRISLVLPTHSKE